MAGAHVTFDLQSLADAYGVAAGSAGAVMSAGEAEATLLALAAVYLQAPPVPTEQAPTSAPRDDDSPHILEARYRTLLEQMSAIVFMAYLDRGVGEAYVSPQIERALGFTQAEWLEDPIRWFAQIHPDDKPRWSAEIASMLLSGEPLRSAYRVLARDGRVVWFHCEARMVRRPDGRPWFVQGLAYDITELKRAESALQNERNVLSAILDTVGALVAVLDPDGRIVRFNRACEIVTGLDISGVRGRFLWDVFVPSDGIAAPGGWLAEFKDGDLTGDHDSLWKAPDGSLRRMAWSTTMLPAPDGSTEYIIATGIDTTERRRLEQTLVEISDQEQRRIGQDLHDGLGQHLTGVAFMSKVLEQKLAEQGLAEAAEASTVLNLVNEAINKTRELARGLLSAVSDEHGLVSALSQIAVDVEDLFRISCRFDCERPVEVTDLTAATHLCHIAREAVNNAIRHGRATRIDIRLSATGAKGVLSVRDDGVGFAGTPAQTGMGLHIMRYRAGMIGGTLQVHRGGDEQTEVVCVFPLRSLRPSSET